MEKFRDVLFAITIAVFGCFCLGEDAVMPSLSTQHDTPQNLPLLDGNSTLADYINYAALNNPALEASFNEWKADAELAPQEKSLDDPEFEYSYYIDRMDTRQSAGIWQSLPWFGKLGLKGQIADQKATASAQKYEAAKLALFYEVSEAYYEYFYLGQAISTTTENISLLRRIENVSVAKYKVSQSSQPDLIRIQVEILRLEDSLAELNDLKTTHIARLNSALNRPVEAELAVPRTIDIHDIKMPDSQIIAIAQTANPQLKSLDSDIEGGRQSIELAKKMYYPDFKLGISIEDSVTESSMDDDKDPVMASVAITIPLWQGKYSAGVREARNRYFAATNTKFDAANTLNSQLKTALYKYRDAGRKIELYGSSLLPKARQSLNVTEADFRAAKADFTSFIDAQRILLEFSLSYCRALADKAIAAAQIEMLTGGAVPLETAKSSELLFNDANSSDNSGSNIESEESGNEK